MYNTYRSSEIYIGNLALGGDNPVRIQSMTNTDTNDIDASVSQCKRMIDAGAEMVRLTTQGNREAESLGKVKEELLRAGYSVPVIADVHFNPAVAEKTATLVDKVRINPGNYTEKRSGLNAEYSEGSYAKGLNGVRERILPLLDICKANDTALRIGVNHGSLSPRAMLKYGDTPLGMAESAMEFIRICDEAGYKKLVVSMKSSNTRIMVQSVRLLVKKLMEENIFIPLHLGVTEAGNGDEGRIRSAVGIAPLLAEGFGDTIRVSLTEAPEKELPVAAALCSLFPKPESLPYNPLEKSVWDPFSFSPPETDNFKGIGGGKMPVVIGNENSRKNKADLIAFHKNGITVLSGKTPAGSALEETIIPLSDSKLPLTSNIVELNSTLSPLSLKNSGLSPSMIILKYEGEPVFLTKNWLKQYYESGFRAPVIFRYRTGISDPQKWLVKFAGDSGMLLIDGLIDGLWPDEPGVDIDFQTDTAFNILQASRARFVKTEYIACPSCGRTLYNIETTLEKIRQATAHLPGLKIAVMGCIVNGPGEMADADYGYVGAGKGLITLYKGKDPVKKGVPENKAVQELIDLIRQNGDWREPNLSQG